MIFIDEQIPIISSILSVHSEVRTFKARTITAKDLEDGKATALFVRSTTNVNQQLLANTEVQFVASATSGTDHIDIDYLRSRAITFAYAPGSNAVAVSDYVFGALEYLIQSGILNQSHTPTIGVVGKGQVGTRVCTRAALMGMHVLVRDPFLDMDMPLKQLLEEADIITLHVPFTTSGSHPTEHMIDLTELNDMRDGTVLINTSRGGIINEHAVSKSQSSLKYVFDVFENEPTPNPDIVKLATIATPHIAGYTESAKECGAVVVLNAYLKFIGKKLIPAVHEISTNRTHSILHIAEMFRQEWIANPNASVFERIRLDSLSINRES